MRRHEPLSPAEIDRIVALRETGLGYPLIAKEVGCDKSVVAWHCLKLAVDPPKPWPLRLNYHILCPVVSRGGRLVRAFTPAEDERLLALAKQQANYCAIARALGRPRNSIKGRLFTLARREARQEAAHA